MIGVGGFAFAQDGGELAVGLGANPQEHVVHGGGRFGLEITDLLQERTAPFRVTMFRFALSERYAVAALGISS